MNNNMNIMNNSMNNMNMMNNGMNNMNMMNNGMNMMNMMNNGMNMMNMMNNGMNMMNMMNNGMNNMNMMNNNMNIKNNGMNNNTMQVLQNKGFNQNNNFNNNQMNNNNKVKANLHKVGLKNLGQTCYMNSSLQCLANIDIFVEKLLKDLNKLNQNTETFTRAFFTLLYQLKTSNEKFIDPSNFKSSLGKFNPLFEGNNASDAKDLILFILQRLHLELKPIKNNSNAQMNFYQQEQISLDDNKSFQCFNNDFKSSMSCVSETFHGIYKIQLKCDGCKRIKYSYQTFNMLTFILKKIKDDKISNIGQSYYDGINTVDAFETDRKVEILKDENMIFCNSCQGSHTGSTQQSIYSLPPVLIIVLNRGKNNQDFNDEFNFPEVLDFNDGNNFVISNHNNYKRFFLCGIITHLGESSSSGHFICYCRNDLNDPFVCYNDTQVAEGIEIDAGMSCNLSENSYEKKTPYILFYHYF